MVSRYNNNNKNGTEWPVEACMEFWCRIFTYDDHFLDWPTHV